MADGPSTSVLDSTKTKFSDDWKHLLLTDDSSCDAEVLPAAAGASTDSPPLKYTSNRYWGLVFDTTKQPQYQIEDSLILNLSSNQTLTKDVESVLIAFGVLPDYRPDGSLFGKVLKCFSNFQLTTDDDSRNYFWMTPGHTCRFDAALTFQATPSPSHPNVLPDISQAIKDEIGIDIQDKLKSLSGPWISLQRTGFAVETFDDDGSTGVWDVSSTFRCTVSFVAAGLLFYVSLDPTGFNITVTPNTRKDAVALSDESFWTHINQLRGLSDDDTSAKPSLGSILPEIKMLKFAVGKAAQQTAWWQIMTVLQWGRSSTSGGSGGNGTKPPLQIYLAYDSESSTFTGGLVGQDFYTDPTHLLLPTYEPGLENILPIGWSTPQGFDLTCISDEVASLPVGFPTTIAKASVSYRASDPKLVSLSARLVQGTGSAKDLPVPCPFNWTELDVRLSRSMGSSSDFFFSASANFTLSHAGYSSANLGVMVRYQTSPQKEWMVSGFAQNLSCGLLTSFFDPKFRDPMNSIVGNLNIASLMVVYTHKSGAATSFLFTGTITLGDLHLNMFYQYASAEAGTDTAASRANDSIDTTTPKPPPAIQGNNWSFECDLKEVGKTATIGIVFASITGEPESTLPSFIGEIVIPPGQGRELISLLVTKTPDDDEVMFSMRVNINTVSFRFIQIVSKGMPAKRILIVSVGKLPTIDGIPLIGQLPQPFDKLEYMWVNSAASGSDPQGITQADAETLNNILKADEKLDYKKTVIKDKPEDKVKNVVLLPGHHFMVIQDSEVAVDHVFGAPRPTPSVALVPAAGSTPASGGALTRASSVPSAAAADTQPQTSAAPAKGALTFKFGPLSVSAITLQYKEQGDNKILALTMDATFAMGPITFSLLGFGLGLPISKFKLNDLAGIGEGLIPELSGLALSFDKPPLLIAGGFAHQVIGKNEIFMGGVGISYPPYTFVGVGEYEIMEGFKSVFLYAKLDGPILTLEFATVEDVRLGFGFNSMLNSPTIAQVTDFPFINDSGTSGAGNDPMKLLDSLCKTPIKGLDHSWVVPKLDSFWLAAGMRVTAFDLLKITAVAMLAFRDSGVIMSIFADAVATMPPNTPPDDKKAMILYVEIGLLAEMNLIDGYFRVEAALAPTSFILVPQCQVFGGFALVYWFPPNSHAGDWVFSVGGYHRQFTPPDWYPVPNRLGISFNIDILSITGEGYFAITPKAAMGGALIHASLAFGPIKAWLDAAFDALVNFHPLHYIVDFAISVGVEFDIDVWFIHIHIGATVGADLHIEGPDFGGVAHVDFYLFGFSVQFGATNSPPPPLTLPAFWSMVHQPGPASTSLGKDDATPLQSGLTYSLPDNNGDIKPVDLDIPPYTPPGPGSHCDGAAHKFVLEDGNFPMPKEGSETSDDPASTGAGAEWHVKGGTFRFRILSDFAISEAQIAGDDTNPAINLTATTTDICSKPMRISRSTTSDKNVNSTLKVTIRKVRGDKKTVGGWTATTFVVKNVPRAVWGSYNDDPDPLFTKAQDQGPLLNGKDPSVPLCMGISLAAPAPTLAESTIPVFNAVDAAKMPIMDFRNGSETGDWWYIPNVEAEQRRYLAVDATAEQESLYDVREKWSNLNRLKQAEVSAQLSSPEGLEDEFKRFKDQGVDMDMTKWLEMMAEIDKEMDGLMTQELSINKDMWDGMKKSWQELDNKSDLVSDATDGVVAWCSTLFEWGKRPQENPFVSPTYDESDWMLKCKGPGKLKLVKRLDETYLALPRQAYV